MGSEDRAASPTHRRCGLTPEPDLLHVHAADASPMHRRCGVILRPHLHSALIGRPALPNQESHCALSIPSHVLYMPSGSSGPRCPRRSLAASRVSCPISSDCTRTPLGRPPEEVCPASVERPGLRRPPAGAADAVAASSRSNPADRKRPLDRAAADTAAEGRPFQRLRRSV